MSGATTATTMNIVSTMRPNTAALRLNSRRRARRAGLSSSSACLRRTGKAASVMASAPQPWVHENVGDVGNQIEGDVDRGRHQHHALHDGIVAVEDGVHDQLAEAGN